MDSLESLAQALSKRLFIPVEASGRHVHLTSQTAQRLFGHGLTPERDLSQPGQYLCRERVELRGPKGSLFRVAVLGPERKENQAELSLTDGVALGLRLPVRLSGSVEDTPGLTLAGPMGEVKLTGGAIAAQRHIHMTPQDAEIFRVSEGQKVRLKLLTRRPLTFDDMVIRVSPDFQLSAHIDFDEANACGLQKGDCGMILLD